MRLKRPTQLIDALYNTHEKSGSSTDYAQGIVVGIVSALMATGMPFEEARTHMFNCLPTGWRTGTIPECWLTPPFRPDPQQENHGYKRV